LPEDVAAPPEQGAAIPVVEATLLGCWPAVLARLAQDIAPEEFSVWLSTTTLLDIIDDVVIIGTPNVFVRNHVRDAYASLLSMASAVELGHPVQVEVVIDTPVLA
jgi:chromosomal replication initiation ATPase DnaA